MADDEKGSSNLMTMDQSSFEEAIAGMSSHEVNQVVERLQRSMLAEQESFGDLTEKLRHSEPGSQESEDLKEALCLSQSRLAQLCSKNMKCFEKQTSTAAKSVKSQEPDESVPRLVELEKTPRKSLSTLHREKKEREEREKSVNNEASPVVGHPQLKDPNSTDETLRKAFETVLGDILGEEHKLGKTPAKMDASPTATSVRKVYISRETGQTPEEGRSKLFDELRSSVPRAPVAAGEESPMTSPRILSSSVYYTPQQTPKTEKAKENPETMLNSREKILEQVRRARDGNHDHHHVTETSPKPRSILKKSSTEKSRDSEDSMRSPLHGRTVTEKFEDLGRGGKMTETVTETRNIRPDGSEEVVEHRMTVLTQQTLVTDVSSSPSPLSSLTSPSSVSSAKFQLKSPSPDPHSDDQKSPRPYSYDASPGTTSPMPYKSPFRNSGIRPDSPERLVLNAPYESHSQPSLPKLPDTTPPTLLPDVVDVRVSKTPELPENIKYVTSTSPLRVKNPTRDVSVTEAPVIEHPFIKSSTREMNGHSPSPRKVLMEENRGDQARILPHALNRARVEVSENGDEKLLVEENTVCREWDPTPLLQQLYKIDYHARREEKRARFVNMEGHLTHLPLGVKSAIIETAWKENYFKTREGRLLWFQRPFADDYPLGDVLLAGSEIDVNKEESTLSIRGGRDGSHLVLKSSPQLLEKWRQALLSHAASSVADCYVQPVYPPVPHPTEATVIIELGSSSVRAGVLTVEPSLPQVFFPTIVTILPNGEVVVGVEALKPEMRHRGTVVRPIRPTQPAVNRYTMDLDIVTHIIRKVFTDLNVQPQQYKNCPTPLIGDLLKLLLREFGVRGTGVVRQPCLVLYAYDVTTGVVLDVGDRMNIVPVIDGYVVQSAIVSLPYGSSQISDSLREKLSEQNIGLYAFISVVEKYILRYIMEQSCRVAPDYEKEVEAYSATPNDIDKTVSLHEFNPTPQMQKEFRVDSAQFTSTEGMMKPKRWGLDITGLHKLLFNSIQTSPMDTRRTLYRNIYLAGGATLLPGLAERLENELAELVAPSIHVQVHMSPWRYHSAYIGAQVVASSIQFDQTLVTAGNVDAFIRKLYASNF